MNKLLLMRPQLLRPKRLPLLTPLPKLQKHKPTLLKLLQKHRLKLLLPLPPLLKHLPRQ